MSALGGSAPSGGMSRRSFVKGVAAGAAVMALPAAGIMRSMPIPGASAFEMRSASDVDVIFAFGRRQGTYDIIVRKAGVEVERHRDVVATQVVHIRSEHVTVAPAAPPAA